MALSGEDMLALLAAWQQANWLRPLDVALVRFLAAECPAQAMSPALMLATALLSHQLGRGHVCLNLQQVLADPYMALSLPPEYHAYAVCPQVQVQLIQPGDLLSSLTLADWRASLQQVGLVESVDSVDSVDSADLMHPLPGATTPLVLCGERLYLRRYWRYERQLEAAIKQRLADSARIAAQLPKEQLQAKLQSLFPAATESGSAPIDWQKIACAVAARSAFSIITGGPGTGKTTTVVRLLALLQALALETQPKPLRIALAAPTGKAAARLKASIASAINSLPDFVKHQPQLQASIPSQAVTLHHLLGVRPASRHFRHNARHPLPLDVLVVDEASMIDLEMMAALLAALPAQARLILLGDQDQLASVEAGSVLGELCRDARLGHFLPAAAQWITELTGETVPAELCDAQGNALSQHIIMLRHSHRFAGDSGIGQLAAAVNAGQPQQIQAVWQRGFDDIQCHQLVASQTKSADQQLARLLLGTDTTATTDTTDRSSAHDHAPGLADYLHIINNERPPLTAPSAAFDHWARQVLAAHGRFQLLCVLRQGPHGVEGLNHRLETLLRQRGLIRLEPLNPWYNGRPVQVTCNDYRLGLMNGDIGITLDYPIFDRHGEPASWGRRVVFKKTDSGGHDHPDNDLLWVLPSRLPAAETVFALTVHKSQGSEFDHCALLLPPTRNPLLTRELIYTAITRGKQKFSLICSGQPELINEAATRTVQRSGGLFAGEGDKTSTRPSSIDQSSQLHQR
ncbi:MAG: exodeoxyribonuclease V subunit alpha [Sterolibacterium sp.]|nr:exodeoxyribonuclease V subunit alpha [Sterolibacterium sp.]